MKTAFSRGTASAEPCDALIVVGFSGGAPPKLGAACDAAIAGLYQSAEFQGNSADLVTLHNPAGLTAKRLVLVGAGKLAEASPDAVRRAAGTAVRAIRSRVIRSAALLLPIPYKSDAAVAAAAVEGAILGDYEPDWMKTVDSSQEKRLDQFTLVAPGGGPALRAGFERGVVLAESQNFARDLGNEPANLLTPTALANRARLMANEAGLEIETLDEDRMGQLGMGSLLGVARGSSQPPVLAIVRYRPEKTNTKSAHLGLVGKGVTFDSGGISIKPAEGMEKMKYDMCGAAGVLGAMRAIARIKPAIAVTALVPAVENMLGAAAQRPGDIVKCLNGKTVEVLNTDAEGRLILNDAITYAQRLGCTHLVDAATLTGAFTNNQAMMDRLLAAAGAQGEKMWQMPLDPEYKDLLKSAFADLANIGGRWGGAISAAYFIKEFADPTPWVHLDIAGTAWHDEAKAWMAKGPTGVCVRTFTELALSWTA